MRYETINAPIHAVLLLNGKMLKMNFINTTNLYCVRLLILPSSIDGVNDISPPVIRFTVQLLQISSVAPHYEQGKRDQRCVLMIEWYDGTLRDARNAQSSF